MARRPRPGRPGRQRDAPAACGPLARPGWAPGPAGQWRTTAPTGGARQSVYHINSPAASVAGSVRPKASASSAAAAMIATAFLLVWEATLVTSAAVRANPPSPDLLLGIPGVNPLIPVGYGIFGLAVAIVLHEFCHGILARAADVKVQSVGAIFLVVPIGAFVEPDEGEMRALPLRKRARLYAAGPATNLLLKPWDKNVSNNRGALLGGHNVF